MISSLSFPATGGWANWAFTATNNVTLNAGINTIQIISSGSNGANVDYMLVATNGTSSPAPVTANTPLRRPVSPNQPMWLIHIDSWNYPDPQKIINLIPTRHPSVCGDEHFAFHLMTSTNGWLQCAYGYETAKSWLKICAENGMWAMIQPSGGGHSHFSDFDLSIYEEFYRDYPNFIGFNYAEQFWGLDLHWL